MAVRAVSVSGRIGGALVTHERETKRVSARQENDQVKESHGYRRVARGHLGRVRNGLGNHILDQRIRGWKEVVGSLMYCEESPLDELVEHMHLVVLWRHEVGQHPRRDREKWTAHQDKSKPLMIWQVGKVKYRHEPDRHANRVVEELQVKVRRKLASLLDERGGWIRARRRQKAQRDAVEQVEYVEPRYLGQDAVPKQPRLPEIPAGEAQHTADGVVQDHSGVPHIHQARILLHAKQLHGRIPVEVALDRLVRKVLLHSVLDVLHAAPLPVVDREPAGRVQRASAKQAHQRRLDKDDLAQE
mmetsp:Transcript_46610/g.108326  ORF Transcript_46610/g.108326 Transcript_46610/m.108326 type:complete len:301 (-) Transcript_46610:20-922(-)